MKLKWKLTALHLTPTPPEGPLPPLTLPLFFQCLLTHHLSMEPFYPLLHTWQSSHEFSRATGDSWNVIPVGCPRDSCSQWKNLPVVFSLTGSLCWGRGNLQGIWWHVASCPTCSLFSQREAAACPESMTSPAQRLKRSYCTPRCFAVKSCLQKLNRRAQHKLDIHSWKTAAMRKPEWTEQEWIMLRLNPPKFECKTKLNRMVYWTIFKGGGMGRGEKGEWREVKEPVFFHLSLSTLNCIINTFLKYIY